MGDDEHWMHAGSVFEELFSGVFVALAVSRNMCDGDFADLDKMVMAHSNSACGTFLAAEQPSTEFAESRTLSANPSSALFSIELQSVGSATLPESRTLSANPSSALFSTELQSFSSAEPSLVSERYIPVREDPSKATRSEDIEVVIDTCLHSALELADADPVDFDWLSVVASPEPNDISVEGPRNSDEGQSASAFVQARTVEPSSLVSQLQAEEVASLMFADALYAAAEILPSLPIDRPPSRRGRRPKAPMA